MIKLRIKEFLSDRRVGIVILALAFLSRMLIQLYFFRTGVDRSLQILASKNFLQGHGFSIGQVFPEDLSREVFAPIVGWPPGYPLFVSLIAAVTGNLTIAAIIFDLISVCILIYFARKILQLSGCSDFLVNCFTLVTGFFLYDFCQVSSPDMSAVAFILWALYLTLVYLKKNKNPSHILLIALINFIPGFLRYMFIPIAFVIPLYLSMTGYVTRNRNIMKGGMISLTITSLSVTALLLFQSSTTGSATFINTSGKGFFPANLLEFYPVIIGAFANLTFIYSFLANTGFKYGAFHIVAFISNCILLLTLGFYYVKTFLTNISKPLTTAQHFIFIGGAISLLITILLIAFSLHYKALIRPNDNWTFVQESRYMAFITMFLQMFVFICLFRNGVWRKNVMLKTTAYIIAFLLIIETLHGIYFTGKILITDKTYFHPDKNYMLQKEFIEDFVKDNKPNSRQLVFTSDEKTYLNIAALHGASVLYNFDSSKKLSSSRAFDLIIVIKNDQQMNYGKYLKHDSTRQIKNIGNISFYQYRNNIQ